MHDPVFSTKLSYFDLVIVFVAYTDSYQTIWEKNATICFSDCKDFFLIIKHTTHVLTNRPGKACYEETFDAITLFSLPCPPSPERLPSLQFAPRKSGNDSDSFN